MYEIFNAPSYASMQYVPDGIATFKRRQLASTESEAHERAEADRKRESERWYERGREALAALPIEKREALETEVKADFLARWPRGANRKESQFFKRMVESAMISRIIGTGQDSAKSSEGWGHLHDCYRNDAANRPSTGAKRGGEIPQEIVSAPSPTIARPKVRENKGLPPTCARTRLPA